MAKISALIICLNEAEKIADCIQSLQAVADEILVLDSFSSDQTPQTCQNLPKVHFVQHQWLGYGKMKNHGHELAKHDFILSLDADERLDKELQAAILKVKPHLIAEQAFSFNRLTQYCGQWIYHSGWYPEWKIRLFHRKNAFWEGDIHERLKFKSPHTKVQKLSGHCLHFTIESLSGHLMQVDKYSSIWAETAYQNHRKLPFFLAFLKAIVKFWKIYLFKKGFLDGKRGLMIATVSAFAVLLRSFKLALKQ